ncbi:MAG: 4Fe-4S single cluster domain-containing protein [Planctomycetia bacterium]|nr:4Fe-4S single cluster domain-containing protein [Planctomycetia bacterium]
MTTHAVFQTSGSLVARLRLARYVLRSEVLGPGVRGVVWVQGCARNCPGCTAPETHDFSLGFEMDVVDLADRFLYSPDLEGLTISGGEPMEQAEGLVLLVEMIRKSREDFSFFCFTGDRLSRLQEFGTPAQKRLLEALDVLVDGPYVQELHADLLWRGSRNQCVHFLTDRYREYENRLSEPGQGVEFEFDERGVPQWTGIPPRPGFRDEYREKMRAHGIVIS